MKRTIEFIQNLIEELKDMQWSIDGIVDVEEVVENGKVYGIAEGIRYKKQHNEFIRQWTGYCEDDYSGVLLKPIDGKKYLKISYSC